jgi:hypothetical protein
MLAAGVLIGGAVLAQDPRPAEDPRAFEPRPPLPRDEFRQPYCPPPPATLRHLDNRPLDRELPRDFRADRDRRPDFRSDRFRPDAGPRNPAQRGDVRERPLGDVRPPGEGFPNRPERYFRPEPGREGREFRRPQERRFPDFRDRGPLGGDFPPQRPPMRLAPPVPPVLPEQNFRNRGSGPEFREFAPMARGPRPGVARPRERDDQWDHRAPRFPREDGRREEHPMRPAQPPPFQ